MQLSDSAIVGMACFALVHTGSLIWVLSGISARLGQLVKLTEGFSDWQKRTDKRIARIELRCAAIHGAIGEQDNNGG